MRQSLHQPQLHSHGSAVFFMVYNPIPVTFYVVPWSNERAGYSKPPARIVLYHPNICPPWLFSCSNIERYSISLWQCGCGMLRIDLTCFENANGLNAPHERSFWKRHIAFAPTALKNIARSGQRWNTVVGKTVLYSCLRCVVHWENYWVSMYWEYQSYVGQRKRQVVSNTSWHVQLQGSDSVNPEELAGTSVPSV